MTIRPATTDDLFAVLALERSAPSAAHWSLAQYEAILNAPADRRGVILVVDNCFPEGLMGGKVSHLAGFLVARAAAEEWEIENVVVAESARRRGCGRQLVEALLDAARRKSATAVFLEVRESNEGARALYEACGFQPAGRRPAYYSCPTEDAILYVLAFS